MCHADGAAVLQRWEDAVVETNVLGNEKRLLVVDAFKNNGMIFLFVSQR